jgi:hypothetical protein
MEEDDRGGINYYNEIKHKKHSLKRYQRLNGKNHIIHSNWLGNSNITWKIIETRPKSESIKRLRKVTTARNINEICSRGEKVLYRSRYHKKCDIVPDNSE